MLVSSHSRLSGSMSLTFRMIDSIPIVYACQSAGGKCILRETVPLWRPPSARRTECPYRGPIASVRVFSNVLEGGVDCLIEVVVRDLLHVFR